MNVIVNRFLKIVYAATIIAFLLVVIGCSDVDSNDLRSSGFYATMALTSSGDSQTNVRACLATSSDLFADDIELSAGDNLTATANGITKTLMRDICYENIFDFDDGGTEFVISLNRDVGVDMPNSNVVLPEKFSILMPSTNVTFNSGESITVTWSPVVGSKTIDVSYSGDCVSSVDGVSIHFGRGYTINDTGIHTVLVDDILNVFGDHSEFDKNPKDFSP